MFAVIMGVIGRAHPGTPAATTGGEDGSRVREAYGRGRPHSV
jgi:hypothetical protein